MREAVNEVDVSQGEIDRDFSQGLAEFGVKESDLNIHYATPGTESSPGPVQPQPGNQGEQQPTADESRKMLADGLTMAFTLINNKAFPGYEITSEENAMLGDTWAGLVNHYFPGLNPGPVLSAVGSLGMVYGIRAAAGIKARPDQDQAQEPEPSQGAQEPTQDSAPKQMANAVHLDGHDLNEAGADFDE